MKYIVVCTFPNIRQHTVRGFDSLEAAKAYAAEQRAKNAADAEYIRQFGVTDDLSRVVMIHEAVVLTMQETTLFFEVSEPEQAEAQKGA